jgi:hypothetical protein
MSPFCSYTMVFSKNIGPAIHIALMAQHMNLLIVEGQFKSLSWINTATVPVLSIHMFTLKAPTLISEKCKVWVKNTVVYCPQEPVTKMRFCTRLLKFLNPCHFI